MKSKFLNNYFPLLKIASTLNAGKSFGEVALENNISRTATIICREPTKVLVLSRKGY